MIETAKIGFPHTKKQTLVIVQQILESKGLSKDVTNGWWERFVARHPQVCLRSAVPFSVARAMATDPDVLNRYFDVLEDCLYQNDIFNQPGRIFNCDETGLPLNPKCLKVVDQKGSKNPSYITSGDKSQLTVLACTCAAGYAIPPYIIFDRKNLNIRMTHGEVSGSLYGLPHNGRINSELFYHWFRDHFLQYIPEVRPILLFTRRAFFPQFSSDSQTCRSEGSNCFRITATYDPHYTTIRPGMFCSIENSMAPSLSSFFF